MAESVIFNSPLLLAGYGVALFLCIFDLFKHSSGILFPLLSAIVSLATSGASLLCGATLTETGTVLLLFLMLNLTVFCNKKGGGK